MGVRGRPAAAQWTFTGYDASASVSEETVDPRRRVPWSIVMAVAVSSVVGYLLLIALTLAITDIPSVLNATDAAGHEIPAVIAILNTALGERAGGLFRRPGRDGDVVLRARRGDLDVARHLRLRARPRDAGVSGVDARQHRTARRRQRSGCRWRSRSSRRSAARTYAVVTSIQRHRSVSFSYVAPVYLSWRARGSGRRARAWSMAPRAIWAGCQRRRDAVGRFHHDHPRDPRQLPRGKTMAVLSVLLSAWYLAAERHRFRGPAWIQERLKSEVCEVCSAAHSATRSIFEIVIVLSFSSPVTLTR